MEFVYFGEQDFYPLWEKFTRNERSAWQYCSFNLRYQEAYCEPWIIKNLSFVLVHEGRPCGLCPLFLEKHGEIKSFSLAGGYLPAPLPGLTAGKKRFGKIERACFDEIDRLAGEYGAAVARFVVDPVGSNQKYNFLQAYGYLDASLASVVLDMDKDENELRAGLRKSYKALINKGKREFNFEIIDHENYDFSFVDRYRLMHHKAAGRVTRPLKTYEIQGEAIQNDRAALINIKVGDVYAAMGYFIHIGKDVYYGSLATDPDVELPVPTGPSMMWAAIEYYRHRGFKWLDIGIQHFGVQLYATPCDHEIDIGMFKRGFGADIVSMYMGVKYYNAEFMRKELHDRMETIIESRACKDNLT